MLASITGIQDHIVSTEDVKEFVGADSFAIMSHLFSPNTHYKLFELIQKLNRAGISDTISNRIIEGVRAAADQAEIATLRAQLAEREQTITEPKKAAQAAAQGADDTGRMDAREERSWMKICNAILRYTGKDISKPNIRGGIKKYLDLDEKTAKKYFDKIQSVMDNKTE